MNVITEDIEQSPDAGLPGREPKRRWYVRLMIKLKLAHTESQAIAEVILICGLMLVVAAFLMAWNELEKRQIPIVTRYGNIDQTRFIPPSLSEIVN